VRGGAVELLRGNMKEIEIFSEGIGASWLA
jgi:hypothetical protein